MKKVVNLSFLFFVFIIPFSQFLSVRVLVVVSILSVCFVYSKEQFRNVVLQNWDLLAYILVLCVGVFYSNDRAQAWNVLETSFCFVGIPIAYAAYRKNNSSNQTIRIFSMAILLASLVLILRASIEYIQTSNVNVFFFYQFTDLVGIQPTYMAYYVIFVLACIIFEAYYKSGDVPISVLLISILFLTIILLFTGGKTAFVSLILVTSFFALTFILGKRSLRKTIVISSVSLIIIAFISTSTSEYFRIVSAGQTDYWERAILWKSALVANPSPLFGVGTGDYKDALNKYYKAQGMIQYATESYNAHNQFIQLYFSNGIFGLMALLLIIGRPLYLSFKVQNTLGILIVFPFIVYGITEVFLMRYQGIVFFVLCHQIVVAEYYLKMPRTIPRAA